MHTRSTTIIAAGVIVAVLGAVTVLAYARNVQGSPTDGKSVTALVATADIPAGADWEASKSSVKTRSIPADLSPNGAVTSPEQLAGLKAVRPIVAGEIVTAAAFGSTGSTTGGLQIPPGFNAVTINMNVPAGVARFAGPGDLVNVFATFKSTEVNGTPTTRLILPNVQVLANRSAAEMANKAGAEPAGDILLTLALKPTEAEKVIFAKENGSMWFGLVHAGDAPASTTGQTFTTVGK